MKLGIMQPYFFPYIGYFQLISAVDQFVIHNDVQWIKGGWINRNRIFSGGKLSYITLPLQKSSSLCKINEKKLSADIERQKIKLMKQIEGAYRQAPQFDSTFHFISHCLACQEQNVSLFIVNTLRKCCDYLGIFTPFLLSSDLNKENTLKGHSRVKNICHILSATQYINPIGGTELYCKDDFEVENIELYFLRTRNISYKQANQPFMPNLSIIDMLMFCPVEEVQIFLKEYDLE